MTSESIIARMFKNIGIVLKKSLSSNESSVVSGLLSVLLKNTKTIYSTDQIDFEGVDIVDIEKFNQSVDLIVVFGGDGTCLLYTSPSPRDS